MINQMYKGIKETICCKNILDSGKLIIAVWWAITNFRKF